MLEETIIHPKILRRASSPDEYQIYRAGLEWDLTDPIVIESADDFKSTPKWRERLTPFHHQVTNLITFCRRLPVTLIADDVGLGKTISAGLIASELISRSRLSKILVVCPKLLGPQWQSELQEKFGIDAQVATGRELLEADVEETGAVITTYNSARLYLEDIPEDRFQMLILDEAHKLRNLYGVEKPPQVAKKFRKALQDRRFRFVLMLTATPIHNRLWDLYSLIDLLTVARGHQNPFGSEGLFARRFIADDREKARQLNPETQEEFRSIVFGYMSRIRRGDAKLSFPERKVLRHQVDPTEAELQLIKVVHKHIKKLNRLAQIGILQALTSSPEALASQLNNMARNGTIPNEAAAEVRSIVKQMPRSAKLRGLGELIAHLKKTDPDKWRLVVFTGRRETQTTIQLFLEEHGMKVGLINGDSGSRNQETISKFKKNPPDFRVIVSTEAGSEGVNLQVANVLVNYDLPWNPMIVEQRIGRVQRLASDHAYVSIYNVTLRNTFEDYIVGRLSEKLQMASHAVGDLEALLQGSDLDSDQEDSSASFEDKILSLVLTALEGKNFEKAALLELESIQNAQKELQQEEAYIQATLGGTDGAEYVGPRVPKLPVAMRSMSVQQFTLSALKSFGSKIEQGPGELVTVQNGSGREFIRFADASAGDVKSTLYAAESPAFQRLVDKIVISGVHRVDDVDVNPTKQSEEIARQWAQGFGATVVGIDPGEVTRCFEGKVLARARATVAHDSYERLLEIDCSGLDHRQTGSKSALAPVAPTIDSANSIGVDTEKIVQAATMDEGISEFTRFYLERREQEVRSAGNDERGRKKLHDDFTPRLELTIVGVDGNVHREIGVRARYRFSESPVYEDLLLVNPSKSATISAPPMDLCLRSGQVVPVTSLDKCQVTGTVMMRHLLSKSDISGRHAQPEFFETCGLSGKRALADELETSAVTGKRVARSLLKKSQISGCLAEPDHILRCGFTGVEALRSEMGTSELSGRPYRLDEQARSATSGKAGHKQEFASCHHTGQAIAISEAEVCESTGNRVKPGILVSCDITRKRVLPSECRRCSVTGKRGLSQHFVSSSVSADTLLLEAAIHSSNGKYCAPSEAQACWWSGQKCHPEDIRICELADVPFYFKYASTVSPSRLGPLVELLDSPLKRNGELKNQKDIEFFVSRALSGRKCESTNWTSSPDEACVLVSLELKSLFGLRVQYAGAFYSYGDSGLLGNVVCGKRGPTGWSQI